MTTKRIAPGLYGVTLQGRAFEVERFPDGTWFLFEARDGWNRDYMQDFATKRAALASLATI